MGLKPFRIGIRFQDVTAFKNIILHTLSMILAIYWAFLKNKTKILFEN
jgi:hypothetical protein